MDNELLRNETEEEQAETIFAPFVPDEDAPYIFVSYAHKDRGRVFPIIKDLYEKGWRVWYDEGIPIGNESDYLTSLADHIAECEIVVAFVTKRSVTRKFVTEKELEYACGDADRRIVFCYLDEDAVLPRNIQLNTALREKYPRTTEAELEGVLESIEGLTKMQPREAVGFTVEAISGILIAEEEDIYQYEKCNGGIRLLTYKGSEENVVIPNVYKGYTVVDLDWTFYFNNKIKTVRIPATVRRIGEFTFAGCGNLTDIYIPASVNNIDWTAFGIIDCKIHCAENSAIYMFAKNRYGDLPRSAFTSNSGYLEIVVDHELDIIETVDPNNSVKYAFCSYAKDKKAESEQIIQKIVDNNYCLVSSGPLTEKEKLKSFRNSTCFIAFLSHGYIEEEEIEYLRMAIREKKSYIVYSLDDSELPKDIKIGISSEQQLRSDNGNENDRLAKLLKWLAENKCDAISVDIPDYEYSTNTQGEITITKYIGNDHTVVIPTEHSGHPIKTIGILAFEKCGNISSVTIPSSITTIEREAFTNCYNLTSVMISDGVKIIGSSAFYDCVNLTSVTIPDSVTSIGSYAFHNSDRLTIYCSIGSYAWRYCEDNVIFHSPLAPDEEAESKAKEMLKLGNMYQHGIGTERDPEKAIQMYSYAADAGNTEAMIELADMYLKMALVSHEDYSPGVKLYLRAATAGDLTAMRDLGQIYYEGMFVERDLKKAFSWLYRAANLGQNESMYNVGFMFDSGEGVHQDRAKAIEWYTKAANAGVPQAMYALGIKYYHGNGVEKDISKAIAWFTKAAKAGNEDAKNTLEKVSKENVTIPDKLPYKAENTPTDTTKIQPHKVSNKQSRSALAATIIILALLAVAVGVQLSGLFDILGWITDLL